VRRVTLAEVARRAKVSSMTVSRVVNGSEQVTERTRQQVERAMAELGYVPNRAARSLVVNRLDVLALVVPDLSNPFFTKLVREAEAAANAAGYTIILGNSDEDPAKEASYIRAISSLGVDGVVLGPSSGESRASVEWLTRRAIPVVLLDRQVEGVAVDLVRGESYEASRLLVEHVIEHGHRRVAMISGPLDVSTASDRERGYRKALELGGIEPDRSLSRHGPYTREAGYRAARSLLARHDPPSAIFAANNFLAFGVLDAARELGARVPEELALVTFDDVEIAAEEPFLTCADQPAEEMGRAATQLLIDRLAGDESPPREVVLPTELRVRRSCGGHPSNGSG
jgi:LacI family transcriptional regulator